MEHSHMNKTLVPVERIQKAILLIRGDKVILDADLAALYGVSTKRLNEQVKKPRSFSGRFHVSADQRREGRGSRKLRPPQKAKVLAESSARLYRTWRNNDS